MNVVAVLVRMGEPFVPVRVRVLPDGHGLVPVGVVPVVVRMEMLVLQARMRVSMRVALEPMQGDTREHEGGGHG